MYSACLSNEHYLCPILSDFSVSYPRMWSLFRRKTSWKSCHIYEELPQNWTSRDNVLWKDNYCTHLFSVYTYIFHFIAYIFISFCTYIGSRSFLLNQARANTKKNYYTIVFHLNGSSGYDDSLKSLFLSFLHQRWRTEPSATKNQPDESKLVQNEHKIAAKKNDFHSLSEHLLFFEHELEHVCQFTRKCVDRKRGRGKERA